MNDWQKAGYLSLATRKRDGSRVYTPVWFAPDGDDFYLFSEGKAGKVKRIRNFTDVLMAPCTVTGKITGSEETGEAEILQQPAEIRAAHKALLKKYGWQLRILDMLSAIAGKKGKRVFIRVRRTQ
ncbi:MAG TPA: PPOX class F420-dependent oxidoreductase [Pseudomonadales bacterium]